MAPDQYVREHRQFRTGLGLVGAIASRATTSEVGWVQGFWLTRDYLPEAARLVDGRPPITRLPRAIGARIEPVLILWDRADGFFEAYWRPTEAYLDNDVRRGISVGGKAGPEAERRAVTSPPRFART